MIENMTAESARSILNYLLEKGRINQEDVNEGLVMCPTSEMMRVVDFVHTMLCVAGHDPGFDHCCQYPIEEGHTDCWKGAAHMQWLRRTTGLMMELGVGSEAEFLRVYNQTKRILDVVAELEMKEPAAVRLAWKLLDLETEDD